MSILPLTAYYVASDTLDTDPKAADVRVLHHDKCMHFSYLTNPEPLGLLWTAEVALDKARVKYGNVVVCACCLS